jgi:hypothetical protein
MMIMTSLGNVADYLFCVAWSPTNASHGELIATIEKDERVARARSHLLISSHHFDTWRDNLVAERARKG